MANWASASLTSPLFASLHEALPTGAILMHRAVSALVQGALAAPRAGTGPHLPHCHTPPWPRLPGRAAEAAGAGGGAGEMLARPVLLNLMKGLQGTGRQGRPWSHAETPPTGPP